MPYEEYMRSSCWSSKREQRLKLDSYRCRLCDHDGSDWRLEVHHRPASYAKIPNESVEDDLITLCARCHNAITNAIRTGRYANRLVTVMKVKEPVLRSRLEVRYGLEESNLSIEIISADAHAQRQVSEPIEQVCQGDEEDQQQAQKN